MSWERAGPANRRHYARAALHALGGVAAAFVAFLTSTEFLKFLKQVFLTDGNKSTNAAWA